MAKIALGSLKGPKGDDGDVTPEALAAKVAAEAARTAAATARDAAVAARNQAVAAAESVPTEAQLTATIASQIGTSVARVFGVPSALGNGVTDATSAILAKLAEAKANGGGIVHVPAGTFLVNATLHIPADVTLRGDGDSSIIKLKANATALSSYATPISGNVTVSPMVCNEQPADGVTYTQNAWVENLALDGNGGAQPLDRSSAGVMFFNAQNCGTRNVYAHDHGNFAMDILATSPGRRGFCLVATNADSILFEGGKVERGAYENVGIRTGASNVTVRGVVSGEFRRTHIQPSGGATRVLIDGVRCSGPGSADQAVGGITIHGASYVTVTNSTVDLSTRAVSAGVTGAIYIIQLANHILIDGNTLMGNAGGVAMDNVSDVTIRGNIVRVSDRGVQTHDVNAFGPSARIKVLDNDIEVVGSGSGIRIAAVTDDFAIRGNTVKASTGIACSENATFGYIENNDVTQCPSKISGAGLGPFYVRDNRGFPTEARGIATMNAGVASGATHGLAVTPKRSEVQISPASAMGAATKFWVTGVSSTGLTVNADAAPGVDAKIAWHARINALGSSVVE